MFKRVALTCVVWFSATADFLHAIFANDHPTAIADGAATGNAIVQTIVKGARFLESGKHYISEVYKSGDVSKPCADLAKTGSLLNEHWTSLSLLEQERIKYKFLTEAASGMVMSAGGTQAVGEAKNFTEIVDTVAAQTIETTGKTAALSKQALKDIANGFDELVQPDACTSTGIKMRLTGTNENSALQDLFYLRLAINTGEVQNVKIHEHHEVLEAIRNCHFQENTKQRLIRFAKADKEILVEGTIPKRFIQIEKHD